MQGSEWGSCPGGKFITARERMGYRRAAPCILLFVMYILLISVVVGTVRFVCCSVKLPIPQPMSFAFFFPFSSPPQQGEGRQSDRVALCSHLEPNHDN